MNCTHCNASGCKECYYSGITPGTLDSHIYTLTTKELREVREAGAKDERERWAEYCEAWAEDPGNSSRGAPTAAEMMLTLSKRLWDNEMPALPGDSDYAYDEYDDD